MPSILPRSGRSAPAPHRATVAAGFVTGLVSGVAARGGDASVLLRRAGIPAAILGHAELRVPIDRYVVLYNAAVEALEDEAFGLFSRPLPRGAFEFLARGALGSADLAEALDRMSRFLRVALPDLALEVTGRALVIRDRPGLWRTANDPRRVFALEWLLRWVHGVACWLAARPLALAEVRFPFDPPPHAADYALIYTEHASFGPGKALHALLDPSVPRLPVRRDAADIPAFMEGAPGKISMLYRRDRDTVRALREFLAQGIAGSPSLDDAARALGLSTRTLHRRLHDAGTSFREVKAAVRRETALAELQHAGSRVAHVAARVGYSEPSAFFRAFRAWTGEAPSRHRVRRGSGRIG
jgi:AraC-like DNA-binding protein